VRPGASFACYADEHDTGEHAAYGVMIFALRGDSIAGITGFPRDTDLFEQLGAPAGRSYHAAFEGENGLDVFDVWDSQEAFEAFGETPMPILGAAGIDPGEPMIAPIHNVVTG